MRPADTGHESTSPELLERRIQELEHERKHLIGLIEILQEIAGTLYVVDILQGATRKMGETFGLDRCSIYLAEHGEPTARLVATYEDPSIRNFVIDLKQYPEIRRALESGETVFIPDVQTNSELRHVQGLLETRRVKSITVVPITWRGAPIGAILLRTIRDGPVLSNADVRFIQGVAALLARAFHNAHQYERLLKGHTGGPISQSREDLRRVALFGFLRRLLLAYGGDGEIPERQLSQAAGQELDRLVDIAMAVFDEEAKSV
jgi:GAF domain-containing protein